MNKLSRVCLLLLVAGLLLTITAHAALIKGKATVSSGAVAGVVVTAYSAEALAFDGPAPHEIFRRLSLAGFRRSHHIVYRPACPGCSGCVPVRVDVEHFDWTQSWRRIRRRNAEQWITRSRSLSKRVRQLSGISSTARPKEWAE